MHRGDRGHFHHNHDMFVVIVIIAILGAIAIPNFLKARKASHVRCASNIVTLAEGGLAQGAKCPATGKPYALTTREGLDVAACPEPAEHLPSSPQLVRAAGGPWTLQQTLPAVAADPLQLLGVRAEVVETPDSVTISVTQVWWSRWILMPVAFLFCLAVTIACIVGIVILLKEKGWGGIVMALIVGGLFGYGAYACLAGMAGSQEFRLERAGARLTRTSYLFGGRTSESSVSGCYGVVPAVTTVDTWRSLVVLHPPDPSGSRQTALGPITAEQLGVAARLDRLLSGR